MLTGAQRVAKGRMRFQGSGSAAGCNTRPGFAIARMPAWPPSVSVEFCLGGERVSAPSPSDLGKVRAEVVAARALAGVNGI